MLCKHSKGFTLVELMVVIAIVAILLALGLPSFEGSMRSNRIATTSNELLASVMLARSEAVRSAVASGICPTADGSTCGTNWNTGWLVWTEIAPANGLKDAGEAVVRHVQGHPKLALTAATTGAASTSLIVFDARGRPNNGGVNRTWALSPDVCPAGVQLRRNFALSGIGQFTTQKAACP